MSVEDGLNPNKMSKTEQTVSMKEFQKRQKKNSQMNWIGSKNNVYVVRNFHGSFVLTLSFNLLFDHLMLSPLASNLISKRMRYDDNV